MAVPPMMNVANADPLVSIVMIFLDEEKFIEEAIQSVFTQTYENWELILVDDGSTDRSSQIARDYARQHPGRVRCLEHIGRRNRGMSVSRNLGLRDARGKYVTFLDADDVWLSRKLQQQVDILESHSEAGFVCGRAQWWYGWTGKPEDIQRDFLQQLDVPLNTVVKAPELLILFLQNVWASPCDVLARREIVEAVGGYEESFRGMFEDQVFHAKLCLRSDAFVSSECWYRYRQHPDACTAAHRGGEYRSTRLTFLNWMKEYLSDQSARNLEVWKVLHRQLWPYRHPLLYRLRRLAGLVKRSILRALPAPVATWLKALRLGLAYNPPTGWVRFGSLRRLTPISRNFGADRGKPIDRYYIQNFLARHAKDIGGRVLEIGDAYYTHQFGDDRVTQSDVLNLIEGNPNSTIVGDLANAPHIPSDAFDCVIVTQTLQYIYDVRAALRTLHRILKPGGVALVTFPGICNIGNDTWDENWCWTFSSQSARRLFGEIFSPAQVQVEAHGNVLVATAFLHGLAAEELRQTELDSRDPQYEVLITVRAVKHEVIL